jgi:hypothetical protein
MDNLICRLLQQPQRTVPSMTDGIDGWAAAAGAFDSV